MAINIFKKVILITCYIATCSLAKGQGCSDAGFCTLNSFKPKVIDSTNHTSNQIKVGVSYGNADHDIRIWGNYLEYNKQLNEKLGLDFKLTSLAQNGNNIRVFGLSDIFVNLKYKINHKVQITLGSKIPLSMADKTLNNNPLPMDYQSSLGTFDLIGGFGYTIKKWQFVAAFQQPITQNNNQYIAGNYSSDSRLNSFTTTNHFKRSGDLLLRVSYPIYVTKKVNLTPSILPIYHLSNDKYSYSLNEEREIMGSKGLTLNGNIYLDYSLNNKNNIQFNLGKPFIVRSNRPDGLTRSFIATMEYRIFF